MLRPSDERILAMWDEGLREHAVDRALSILSAFTGDPKPVLARLSIGKRDELLVRARAALLGPRLASYAECPACGERLEFEFSSEALLADGAAELPPARYHLPDSFDLAAVASASSVEEGRAMLLERCGIAEAEVDAALAEIATIEAASVASVDLTCPACSHASTLPLDIAAFFWEELNVYARRRLREVDALARAYGWTEHEILSLSPVRRSHYLEMVS
jgi:hypothetical protein